jgi:uncharacterized membrane protein
MSHSGQESATTRTGAWLGRLSLLLLLAYPFALHLGVLHHRLQPALLILLSLFLLLGVAMASRGNRYGWLMLAATGAAGIALSAGKIDPALLVRLPPVVINGLLCLLFGHTLLPGQHPLISRFAEIIHGHALDDRALRYTRGVTQLWTGLFAFMALESLLLGLLAPPTVWSLFTNFFNYLLVGLVFLLEYRLRLKRLTHLEHPGFGGFLLALRRIDWRRLW